MSMIGCFVAVGEDDFEALIEKPSRMRALLGMESPPPARSFLSLVFGGRKRAEPTMESWKPKEKPQQFDVDKAWQGIHFLLTGTDWEGNGPLAFILHGGISIDEDLGYGPPHGFKPAEVKEIARALEPVSPESLFQRASREEFQKRSIYPTIWDEPKEECIGYVTTYFGELKDFIKRTADSNSALIAYIG